MWPICNVLQSYFTGKYLLASLLQWHVLHQYGLSDQLCSALIHPTILSDPIWELL